MTKPVLLVIDLQNDFLRTWDAHRSGNLIAATNDLITIMRAADRPVIWVRQEFEPDLSDAFPEMKAKRISITIKGTEGCRIHSDLNVLPSDIVVIKKRYSAFFGTNLDALLAQIEPDEIILAGINTHACIRTTAIDAYQRDWPIILATDCIGSYDRVHHEVSLQYMKDKIASLLSNAEIGQSCLTCIGKNSESCARQSIRN